MKDNGDSETAVLGFVGRWYLNRVKNMGERRRGKASYRERLMEYGVKGPISKSWPTICT